MPHFTGGSGGIDPSICLATLLEGQSDVNLPLDPGYHANIMRFLSRPKRTAPNSNGITVAGSGQRGVALQEKFAAARDGASILQCG